MSEFKDRLDEAMRIRGITAAELARTSQVNEGAISQYRAGKYKASQRSLDKLARALRVSIPWLMGADVPMELSEPQGSSPVPSEPQNRETEDLNDSFAILSRKAKKLTPEQRDKLLEMASLMFEEEFRD